VARKPGDYLAMACVGPRLSAIVRAPVIAGEITFKHRRIKRIIV
jgi:hypothetical protein